MAQKTYPLKEHTETIIRNPKKVGLFGYRQGCVVGAIGVVLVF